MRAIYLHWLTPNDIFWTTDFWWLSEFDQFMAKRTGFYSRCYFWQKSRKNYKISCTGNGNPPQRWRKTWKWCQFLLIFECHDCSVSFRSFALGSREVTWTTSDLISRDWRRIQFWKCSIFAFLRKIVKDEIEKLQNWIKFITKRFDPFWNIQKHPKWIFSAHSRQFGSVQKILEFFMVK